MILRDYQQKAADQIRDAFRRGRRSVALVSPTGSGKTVVMSYIAQGAQAKNNRLTILVHRQELVRQTSRALDGFGVRHGFIVSGEPYNDSIPVQLAMVQTLVKRTEAMTPPTMMIVDEFHHAASESYLRSINRFPDARILGLTATPQRLDGKGLGGICEELIHGPSVQSLIDAGHLSRPIYYAPPNDLDMSSVKRSRGDFNQQETEAKVDRPTITGNAVEHYRRLCDGKSAVAFCVSIKHAQHVKEQFLQAGYLAEVIDGNLSDASRLDRVDGLASGKYQILVSVDVVSEGFDLPAVAAAILLRPTESLSLHMQQIGRVLRPAPGKPNAIILDHVGNCMRHGLAEEEREWTLEGRVGKKKAGGHQQAKLFTCRNCNAVHVPSPECPACGYTYTTQERKVAEEDGSLEMLTMAAILKERERVKAREEVGRAKTRQELEVIAKARGYSPKWVRMMLGLRARAAYREKIDRQIVDSRQGTLL